MPRVLRACAPIAADALLPGDPAKAMMLAQELIDGPLMSNHAHGLWGYGGETAEGLPLTIQSTGIGGPSAALVLADLAEFGVKRAIRVGPCVAAPGGLGLGELVVVERAIAADGVGRALSDGFAMPDRQLFEALSASVSAQEGHVGRVWSTDLIDEFEWARAEGALGAELVCAALFASAPRAGVAVAAALLVTDADGESLEGDDLDDRLRDLGRLALSALA